MKSSSRPLGWLIGWVVLGVALAAGFAAAVVFQPLKPYLALPASPTPLASSAPPVSLEPQPTPSPTSPPPTGVGVISTANPAALGKLPNRENLTAKLGAIDTTKLLPAPSQALASSYQVIDLKTGAVVAAANADTPLIPASNTKLLTTTAVLNAFTGHERFTTKVVSPQPGQLVLVGGGDPMLATRAAPAEVYPRPASLQELATATAAALRKAGRSSVSLGYDASLFTGEGWNHSWPARYKAEVTTISALWSDEGREANGVHSQTPALLAATNFAAQLKAAGIEVTGEPTSVKGSGAELARVESLPVQVLAEQAMLRSNNSFTEVLGRQLALKRGQPASFAGAVAAVKAELSSLGLWQAGTVLHDTSGLARENRISAANLAAVIRRVTQQPRLSGILDGLPVAGVSGTLAKRFSDPVASPARGIAKAKTGTLNQVATLVGVTTTKDGRQLGFVFMSNGAADGLEAKLWTDRGAGVVTGCGC